MKSGIDYFPLDVTLNDKFELIEADSSTEVIATYSFNVNSTGAEELAAVSDTTTFAAVTRRRAEGYGDAYYFAGDFNDYTTKRQISNFLFADTFFQFISFDRAGDVTNFYWNFYEPMMKKIFKDIFDKFHKTAINSKMNMI